MATVNIVTGQCLVGSRAGITQIPASRPETKQALTSSPASQQAAATIPSGDEGRRFWQVTALGGLVWVQFGPDPTASPGNDWLVLDGQTREWAAQGGDKIAVIDA